MCCFVILRKEDYKILLGSEILIFKNLLPIGQYLYLSIKCFGKKYEILNFPIFVAHNTQNIRM